jgi:GrpB-like predicted nucleotidyltransferase (UPF0157 family)
MFGYDPKKEKIEVVEYDSAWPETFLKEEENLKKTLAGLPGLAIEHFGSTSVSGLAAKPVIDIMISVESKAFWPQTRKLLERLSYYFQFENEEEIFLIKVPLFSPKRTHHAHIYEYQGIRWKRELGFRDYLRSHPDEARRYESLKRQLAEKFSADREAYTKGKESYIQDVLAKISLG